MQLHKNAASNFEQVLEVTPHKVPAENYQSDDPDMQDIAGEAGTSS